MPRRRQTLDCAERMAAVPRNRSSDSSTVKLQPGNTMPVLPAVEPRRFTVSVVVDTVGRAEPATLKAPADPRLSATVEAMRTVLAVWHFSRLG